MGHRVNLDYEEKKEEIEEEGEGGERRNPAIPPLPSPSPSPR